MAPVHGNYTRDMQGGGKKKGAKHMLIILDNKNQRKKPKTKKLQKIQASSALHETKCDGVPNHATPPTQA